MKKKTGFRKLVEALRLTLAECFLSWALDVAPPGRPETLTLLRMCQAYTLAALMIDRRRRGESHAPWMGKKEAPFSGRFSFWICPETGEGVPCKWCILPKYGDPMREIGDGIFARANPEGWGCHGMWWKNVKGKPETRGVVLRVKGTKGAA